MGTNLRGGGWGSLLALWRRLPGLGQSAPPAIPFDTVTGMIQLGSTRGTPNCSHEYVKVDFVAIQDAIFFSIGKC